jgi:glycerol-3-phosphate O-acyltransferase
VPVYIGYEKLPEGASFVGELAGRPKRRESWWGLLSSLRLLCRRFGKVYVNFGEPLPLADWLDARHPDWRGVAGADWQRAAVGEIADELARRINAAALANPVNLVALALLAAPQARADADALARQIEHLQDLLEPGAARAAPEKGAACIAVALRLEAVRREEHAAGSAIVANEHEAALLAYFRNNVLHLFALPALAASLIDQHAPLAEARLPDMAAGLFGLLRDRLYLRCAEDGLAPAMAAAVDRLAARGLVTRHAGMLVAPPAGSAARGALAWLGEMLRPMLAAAA